MPAQWEDFKKAAENLCYTHDKEGLRSVAEFRQKMGYLLLNATDTSLSELRDAIMFWHISTKG